MAVQPDSSSRPAAPRIPADSGVAGPAWPSTGDADELLNAAVQFLRSRLTAPRTAVILGTGLGRLADELHAAVALDYSHIPGFQPPTALGHRGRLVYGGWAGQSTVLLSGRLHGYEGWAAEAITFPVRVLQKWGVDKLIVTNAAGGLASGLSIGDLVVLTDHLNFQGAVGPWTTRVARSFPGRAPGPTSRPARPGERYDAQLIASALSVGRRLGLPVRPGVYAAVTGPNYETRAEQRMFRQLGADVIGMSTAPEVECACGLGLRVLGLSTVTNVCRPDAPETASGELVAETARVAAPRLARLLDQLLSDLTARESGSSCSPADASLATP